MIDRLDREKPTAAQSDAPVGFSVSDNSFFAEANGARRRTIEKFVVFFLNRRCCAVTARAVAEVARPLSVARLPRSPEWLAGVANLRGEVIPVFNPAKITGAGGAASCMAATKFIILRAPAFASPIALPVDRVSEIVAFGDEEFASAPGETAAFVVGVAAYQTEVLHLLDADEMLASVALDSSRL